MWFLTAWQRLIAGVPDPMPTHEFLFTHPLAGKALARVPTV